MPNWLVGKERQLVDFTVVYAHRGERTLCRSAEILLPNRLPGCRIPGTKSTGLPDAWRGSISKLDLIFATEGCHSPVNGLERSLYRHRATNGFRNPVIDHKKNCRRI